MPFSHVYAPHASRTTFVRPVPLLCHRHHRAERPRTSGWRLAISSYTSSSQRLAQPRISLTNGSVWPVRLMVHWQTYSNSTSRSNRSDDCSGQQSHFAQPRLENLGHRVAPIGRAGCDILDCPVEFLVGHEVSPLRFAHHTENATADGRFSGTSEKLSDLIGGNGMIMAGQGQPA